MMPDTDAGGKRVYNKWAGNPTGCAENTEHCIAEIFPEHNFQSYQCQRKRGYGDKGLYCKQHAKRYLTDGDSPPRNYGKSTVLRKWVGARRAAKDGVI
jgi:hypothetical protein